MSLDTSNKYGAQRLSSSKTRIKTAVIAEYDRLGEYVSETKFQ